MEILWHGYSCFSFKTKQATVVTNPYQEQYGKLPDLKADIVILTGNYPEYNNLNTVMGESRVIDWPGEYEIKGLAITMREIMDEAKTPVATIMTLHDQNLRLCFVEKIGKGLTDDLIESLGEVDILVVNVGDKEGLNASTAHKLIEELEPRSVIPMHYNADGLGGNLETIEPFLKLIGGSNLEPKDKWSVQNRSQLREDATEYVLLKVS